MQEVSMEEVSGQTRINLPIEACWSKMRDFSLAHNYVPGVLGTEITTAQREGVGASRKVFMKNAPKGLDETIIEWTDGESFTLRLHRGEARAIPLFDEFHFVYRLEAAGGQTLFRPAIRFRPRFGLLGTLLSTLVLKRVFRKTLAVIGQSLAEFYETERPTSPARITEIKKSV